VGDPEERAVTRANRRFGAAELAGLDRDELRQICHGLLLGEGAVVEEYHRGADYDDFTASASSIWRPQRITIRIVYRNVKQEDVDMLLLDMRDSGIAEALVLTGSGVDGPISAPVGIWVIPPAELAARITSSPLVSWSEGAPDIATDRLELLFDLTQTASLLDPVGIQWLPALALNELPSAISTVDIEPQDLLERKAFRVLTASFRFSGTRYGESARGKRLPDAVLHFPNPASTTSAMVDCKAASSGYHMDADHLLRFERYWDTLAPQLAAEGRDLTYLAIVSSHFPGASGARHPYYGRAKEIEEKTGLKLAYVSASDLAWAAARVEAADLPLDARASIAWEGLLDQGLVSSEHFVEALAAVGI